MNKINLPFDVMNIIKGFTFYDKKNASQIMEHNQCMKQIVETIKHADSRYTVNIEDDDEQWMFGFVNENMYRENPIQLQGVNCKKCGNYTYNVVPENIFCDGLCKLSV